MTHRDLMILFIPFRRVLWTVWLNKHTQKSGREMMWTWVFTVIISTFLHFITLLYMTINKHDFLLFFFIAPIHRHPLHRTGGKWFGWTMALHCIQKYIRLPDIRMARYFKHGNMIHDAYSSFWQLFKEGRLQDLVTTMIILRKWVLKL